MARALLIIVLLLLVNDALQAQSADDVLDELTAELDDAGLLTDDALESLADLRSAAEDSLFINLASPDELSRLFFLTDGQVRSLLYHRQNVGQLHSLYDLLAVPGFSRMTIQRMAPFISFNTSPSANMWTNKNINADLLCRVQRTWPLSKGYKRKEDGSSRPYIGQPYKSLVRLRGEALQHVKFGAVAENDAGEPMFSHSTSTTDFTSAYVSFSGPSWLKKAVIGHYGVHLGQGLGAWTGFGMDPLLVGTSTGRLPNGINGTTSSAENGFLRGIAAELNFAPLQTTLYASLTDDDAVLHISPDSSHYYITNLSTSGLHRTTSERSHRKNVQTGILGAYLSLDFLRARVGLGINNRHSSLRRERGTTLYRQHYPEGRDLTSVHADVRAFFKVATLFAEVATQGAGANGATAGATFYLPKQFVVSVSGRTFGRGYYAEVAQPVSRSSRAGGEDGVTFGVESSKYARVAVNASADIYRLRVPQSYAVAPSMGRRYRCGVNVSLPRDMALALRFRHTEKEVTAPGVSSTDSIVDGRRHKGLLCASRNTSIKGRFSLPLGENVLLKTSAEYVFSHYKREDSKGLLVGQSAQATLCYGALSLATSINYYDTETYEARVYASQPNVQQDMSFGSCYGHGLLITAMAHAKAQIWPTHTFHFYLWGSLTKRFDVQTIGSGNDLTNSSARETVKVQIIYKLRNKIRKSAT